LNIKGWSEFSPITYILAASVPSKPKVAPILISVDKTQITVKITPYSESNGAPITSYELFMKEESNGAFTLITTFDPEDSMEYIAVAADRSMTEGFHYFFIYRSVNSVGNSKFSDEINVALIDYPAKPTTPAKVDQLSSLTSIYVAWDDMNVNDLNVLGYVLLMDSGNDGDFKVVLNGKGMPGLNYKLVEGTIVGQSYSFKV
jgi:hypothetical protein